MKVLMEVRVESTSSTIDVHEIRHVGTGNHEITFELSYVEFDKLQVPNLGCQPVSPFHETTSHVQVRRHKIAKAKLSVPPRFAAPVGVRIVLA